MFRILKLCVAATLPIIFLIACGGGGGGDSSSSNNGDASSPPTSTQDAPGKISGLGTTPGMVEGSVFVYPVGIITPTQFDGMFAVIASEYFPSAGVITIYSGEPVDKIIGSGYPVTVRIPLQNSTDKPIVVNFPAGLVFVANKLENQNGVLLQDTSIIVPANSTLAIALVMYCGSLHVPGSKPGIFYQTPILSSSSTLNTLITPLKNKKINVEKYAANDKTYEPIADRLQTMLHNLTNRGIAITADDLVWINNLPNNN